MTVWLPRERLGDRTFLLRHIESARRSAVGFWRGEIDGWPSDGDEPD